MDRLLNFNPLSNPYHPPIKPLSNSRSIFSITPSNFDLWTIAL